MAFPMRALVDELRERSGVARDALGAAASRGRGAATRPSLVYWRPILAAGLFTVSFMVTVVVAGRRGEAASPSPAPMPSLAKASAYRPAGESVAAAERPRRDEPIAALAAPKPVPTNPKPPPLAEPPAVAHFSADPTILTRMEDLFVRRPVQAPDTAVAKLIADHLAKLGGDGVRLGCQRYGTAIDFVLNPTEAARLAKAEDKLTLVLHVSGNFEDDAFT